MSNVDKSAPPDGSLKSWPHQKAACPLNGSFLLDAFISYDRSEAC